MSWSKITLLSGEIFFRKCSLRRISRTRARMYRKKKIIGRCSVVNRMKKKMLQNILYSLRICNHAIYNYEKRRVKKNIVKISIKS